MDSPDPAYFSRLPLELVYDILRHAARAGATSGSLDLAWSMSLPRVCRTVHAEVTPILYHTLVFPENLKKHRALMRKAASQGVVRGLRHVRRVYMYRWLGHFDPELFAQALGANCKDIRAIHAPMTVLELVGDSEDFSATEIQIEYAPLELIVRLGTHCLQHLTHLSAFWPEDPTENSLPQFRIARALPALTHLAIRFADFHEEFGSFDAPIMLRAMRAVLKHQGMRRLVIELTGQFVHMRLLFEARLGELKDARVHLSVNNSATWQQLRKQAEEDALRGRGRALWQRGRPVYVAS